MTSPISSNQKHHPLPSQPQEPSSMLTTLIGKTLTNHQNYQLTFTQLKNRIICSVSKEGLPLMKAIPVFFDPHSPSNLTIQPYTLTVYSQGCVIGPYGLQGGMKNFTAQDSKVAAQGDHTQISDLHMGNTQSQYHQRTQGHIFNITIQGSHTHQTAQVTQALASLQLSPKEQSYAPLIQQKLQNPHKELTFEESINVLLECISLGNKEAQKAQGKEVTIFIGNTGAGKSTLVNYLYGCEMESKRPKDIGLNPEECLTKTVIRVKPNSHKKELMEVGHTRQSMTFMPQIEVDKDTGLYFCDCPGFLDDRGYEINIANAVNIRNTLAKCKGIKVVILINKHSLMADRGRGFKEMIQIACHLFGSRDNLVRYKDSLLLGVTQLARESEDNPSETLEELRKKIASTPMEQGFDRETLKGLAEHLFIYDPLNKGNLEYEGTLTREQLIEKIKRLPLIKNPKDIFKTVLRYEEENKLVDISDKIGQRIEDNLKRNDFRNASIHLEKLKSLTVVEHPTIERIITTQISRVESKAHTTISTFKSHCYHEEFQEATALYKTMETALSFFQELSSIINLDTLNGDYNKSQSRKVEREAKEREYQRQLQNASKRIEELDRLLLAQKQETEKQFQELEKEHLKQLESLKIAHKEQEGTLQINMENLKKEQEELMAKQREELKLATDAKDQEMRKKIEENMKKLETQYQEKIKGIEKEKQSNLVQQQQEMEKERKAYQEREKSLNQKITTLDAQRKEIERQKQYEAEQIRLKELEKESARIKAQQAQELARQQEALRMAAIPEMAFGKAKWQKYFGDIGTEPPLPKDIDQILKSPCPYWSGKKVEETHLLVLVPSAVNGKAFTIGTLGEMIKSPKTGHSTKYHSYDTTAVKELKDQGISSSYWALITKDVLPNSRNKTYSEQQPLIKSPYAFPTALEIATGILMHYAQTGERLYPDNPNTYTRCKEKLSKGYRVVVGSFGSSGLIVDYGLLGDGCRHDRGGLCGARKF